MPAPPAAAPRVSVIVPVHNGGPLVRRLAQSLLAQTILHRPEAPGGGAAAAVEASADGAGVEFLFVDNGSTDDSMTALAGLAVTRLSEPRPGGPAARNAGARAARGGILAFVDQDCLAERRWLERLVARFDDPAVEAAAGETLTAPGDGPVPRYLARIRQNSAAESLNRPVFPFAPLNNFAVRRALFERVGGLDEALAVTDDADFSLRLIRDAGVTIHFVPDALVFHEPRRTTAALFAQYRKYGRGWADLLLKHPAELRWTPWRGVRADLDVAGAALRVMPAGLRRVVSGDATELEFRRLDFVRRLGHRLGFVEQAVRRGRWLW